MPLALLLLTLFGCVEPPILDPVEEKLSDRVMAVAEPQIRLFIGIAGVIAESCTTESVNGYTFEGDVAHALGITSGEVVTNTSGDHTWTFSHVGIDGTDGDLVLTTDSERTSFAVTYTAPNDTLVSGEFHILSCEPPESTSRAGDTGGSDTSGTDTADTGTDTGSTGGVGYVVNVSGNMDTTTASETDHMAIDGDKPYSSLTWAPPTAIAPMGGWINWGDAEQNPDNEVTLEGASNINYDTLTWPAKASGSRWARTVDVKLP